jgi:hypothetical protein
MDTDQVYLQIVFALKGSLTNRFDPNTSQQNYLTQQQAFVISLNIPKRQPL